MRALALALAGAVSLGVLATPAAFAQDTGKGKEIKTLVTKAPPKKAAAKKAGAARADAGYSWTGFQIGMTTGHLWGKSSWANAVLPGGLTETKFTQGMLGVHLGAQVQIRNGSAVGWVLGTEFAYSGAPGHSVTSQQCLFDATQGCRTRMNDLLTIGGRLGLGYQDFLLFGSGGYAQARVRTEQLLAGDVCNAGLCDRTRASGWYAGLGLDYKIAKIDALDFILGIEWQHIRVDTSHLVATGAARDVDVSADVVRARFTVKYNPFNGTAEGDYKIDW